MIWIFTVIALSLFNTLANITSVLRRYDEAEALYDRAIAMEPDVISTHLSRALHYISGRGDIVEARRALNGAQRLGGSSKWPIFLAALINLTEGRHEDVLQGLTTAEGTPVSGTGDNTDYYIYKALSYQRMNQDNNNFFYSHFISGAYYCNFRTYILFVSCFVFHVGFLIRHIDYQSQLSDH